MMNLREDLLKLILEAGKKDLPKGFLTPDKVWYGSKEAAEADVARQNELAAKEAQLALARKTKVYPYHLSEGPDKLGKFIQFFVDREKILPSVSRCLKIDFDPTSDTVFKSAISSMSKFCIDFTKSHESGEPTELIQALLDEFKNHLIEYAAEEKKPSDEFDTDEEETGESKVYEYVQEFFSSTPKHNITILSQTSNSLRSEFINFYIACKIVGFYALASYGKSENIKDLYSVGNGKIKASYLKLSDLFSNDAVYEAFKNSNTESSEYIKGILSNTDDEDEESEEDRQARLAYETMLATRKSAKRRESKKQSEIRREVEIRLHARQEDEAQKERDDARARGELPQVDEGSFKNSDGILILEDVTGDIGEGLGFLETFIYNSTISLLSSVLIKESFNFNIKEVFKDSIKVTANALVKGTFVHANKGEISDIKLTDETLKDVEGEASQFDKVEAAELYKAYASDIEALQEGFGVAYASTRLSSILTSLLIALPKDYFKAAGNYFIPDFKTKTVKVTNLFSNLSEEASESIAGRQRCVVELSDLSAFINSKGAKEFLHDLSININDLPKTLEDGYATFVIPKNLNSMPDDSIKVLEIKDSATRSIDRLFDGLCKVSQEFYSVSPKLTSKIDINDLVSTSKICKRFNITLLSKNELGELEGFSRARGVKSALKALPVSKEATKAIEDLNFQYDRYVQTIQELMNPTLKTNSVWGLTIPTVVVPKTLPRPAFPTKNAEGIDTTPVSRGKKLHVYDSEASFTEVARKIVSFLELPTTRARFISAKAEAEIKAILHDIVSIIPEDKREQTYAFSSPGTVTVTGTDNPGSATIGDLLNPKYSLGRKGAANPFLSLAKNIIKHNSSIKESVEWLLEGIEGEVEAIDPMSKKSEFIMYAIINIHLRAQALVAINDLFMEISRVLKILRSILGLLKRDPKVLAGLRVSSGSKIAKFANDVCTHLVGVLVDILTKGTKTNLQEVFETSADFIIHLFNGTAQMEAEYDEAEAKVEASGGRGTLD